MIESLDVILWDKKVGTLVANREGHRSKACFYFDSDYVRNGYDIAPLRAPVKGVAAQRGLPVYPDEERLFGGLPSFIADSLPDHWGNTVFNEWAKVHHIRMRDLSALDRLAYIGRRGMGALEFVPPTAEELETPFKVEIADLYQLARQAFEEAGRFNVPVSGNLMVESLFKVGTSAGGRRPKAVVNVNFEEGQCYSGQVATPYPGYTPMIVKFDEHQKMPTTRIEYSYYLMAVDAELQMMPSRLLEGERVSGGMERRHRRLHLPPRHGLGDLDHEIVADALRRRRALALLRQRTDVVARHGVAHRHLDGLGAALLHGVHGQDDRFGAREPSGVNFNHWKSFR